MARFIVFLLIFCYSEQFYAQEIAPKRTVGNQSTANKPSPTDPKVGEQTLSTPIVIDKNKKPADEPLKPTIPSIIANASSITTGNPAGQSPTASPEAAFNNRIKDIPVNLFTGTPIIDFPIYTLSEPGGVSVPISLNYNASGMKAADVAASVGMNFTLNAGGMITRQVRGIPDEGKFSINDIDGTLSNEGNATFFERKGFFNYNVSTNDPEGDSQPDVFYLNIAGGNYKFSFDEFRQAHFYPDADIKVEVTCNPVFSGSYVSRFTNWIFTMPNGAKYFFNGDFTEGSFEMEANEAKNNYPLGFRNFNAYRKAENVISAWYLTKIQTTFGHETNFEYGVNKYSFFKLAEQEIQTNNCSFFNVEKKINKVFIESATLYKIGNRNIDVIFNENEITCQTLFQPGLLPPVISFCTNSVNYPKREDIDTWDNTPTGSSNAKLLKKITIRDKNSSQTAPKLEYTLDYDYSYGADFNQNILGYSYATIGYTHQRRLKLRQINLPDLTNYKLKYYDDNSVVYSRFTGADHWGYQNGTLAAGLMIGQDTYRTCGNNSFANRSATEGWSQYGTLTEIAHSMGTKTNFVYENHTAHNYTTNTNGVIKPILIGGSRIKTITHSDLISNITTKKAYEYKQADKDSTSGFLALKPVYKFDSDTYQTTTEYWNSALYAMLLSESGRPTVGYSRVKETIQSGVTNAPISDNIGYTVSEFNQRVFGGVTEEIKIREEISTCQYFPEPPFSACTLSYGGTKPYKWIPYHDFVSGTPKSVSVYNKNGELLSQKTNIFAEDYIYENNLFDVCYSKRSFRLNGQNYNFNYGSFDIFKKFRLKSETTLTAGLNGTNPITSTLKSETTLTAGLNGTNPITSTVDYTYKDEMDLAYRQAYPGKHNQVVKTTTTIANEQQVESTTKYAADFEFGNDSTYVCYFNDPQTNDCLVDGYDYTAHIPTNTEAKGVYQLKQKHIFDAVIETISKQNGNITGASYQTYDENTALPKESFTLENLPRNTMAEVSFSANIWAKDTDYDLKSTVIGYNDIGLPLEMKERFGATSKIEYDATGTLPLKTYKNFGTADEQSTQTAYGTKIFGISKEIGSNELEVRKEFYSDGKLKQVLDKDNNVLSHTTYLYRGVSDPVFGTDPTKNRVISRIPRIATADATSLSYLDCNISIQYLDGAGRSMVNVAYRASPNKKDMVSGATGYDAFGRPFRSYLPIESDYDDGRFMDTTAIHTKAKAFYGDAICYTEIIYQDSPLSRPLKSYGVGKAFRDNNKFTESKYETIDDDFNFYSFFTLINQDKGFRKTSIYDLLKKTTIDERGSTVVEYTDKSGNTIRRDVQTDDNEYLTTAYVFDDANRLRYTLPPNAYNILKNQVDFTETDPIFNEMIYAYHYDGRGRVYETHTPGTGWSRVVYNRMNQPILTQDDDEASTNTWNYAQTDGQGRTVRTGQIQTTDNRETLQGYFNNYVVDSQFEERSISGGNVAQYTNRSFPTILQSLITTQSVKTVAYYDNYDWLNGLGNYDFQANSLNSSSYSKNVSAIGLNTGGLIKDDLNGNLLMPAVSYYDDKNRSIQSVAFTHLLAIDRADTKFNFIGEVLQSKAIYRQSGKPDISRTTSHTYDHVGRPKVLKYGLSLHNGGAEFPMNMFNYDAIGRLKTKYIQPSATQIGNTEQTGLWNVGSTWAGGSAPDLQTLAVINAGHTVNIPANTSVQASSLLNNGTLAMGTGSVLTLGNSTPIGRVALQAIDYSYNIRGQLRGINLDNTGNMATSSEKLFSYKLDYHEDNRYYDGNISRQSWKTNQGNEIRGYTYTYDRSNRLKDASYNGVGNENCSVSTNYDLKGNITNLKRFSKTGANSWGLVDNLTYNYIDNGSKLQKVDDAISGNIEANDFRDVTGNDYEYTTAGKLTKDANKGITEIKYNFLDLVKEVNFTDGRKIEYFYNTAGKNKE